MEATVEIRVLGSFEVLVDGTPRGIPGAGERVLLALLACAGDRTVGKDRLIDELWGEQLPANPRNALHLRVSKLRRVIGDALVSDPPGYRLDVGEGEVDARRFEQLVAARRHAAALALWRGPPLEEFADHVWARAEAARLTGLRATAVEDWIDERLAAGENASVVAELERLVAADPLRERLRGQLMTALYRCGRTADALAVYRDVYQLLDEELGVTPSVPLRRLQEAILRQDAALDAVAAVPAAQGNLPTPLSSVVGRELEVSRLLELSSGRRLVTVTGPGGIGKTTVALAAARRAVDDHAHGVWLVRLSSVRDGAGIPTAIADALDLPTAEATSVRQLVISWLAPRRALLVLDNCEHLIDACAEYVEALLVSAGDALRVVATSREALGVHGEVQMPVAPLPPDDAVMLFADRAAAVRPGFDATAAEPAVRHICERLDGMPLAIELAAGQVAMLSPDEIAARLDDRFRLLTGGPRTAEARHRTLRAAVAWSHELLTPAEQTLFRQLAVFAGGWTLEAAEAVCTVDGDDVLDLLGRLVRQSLVVAEGSRFRMLETIRVYAAQLLEEDGGAATVRERHARFFTDLAEAIEPALRGGEQSRSLASLHAEDANLRLALGWAREHALSAPDVGLRLAGALGWYWYVGRQVDGRVQLRATLDAVGAGSPAARARALQALSLALRPAGCIVHPSAHAAAAAEESRALFTTVGDTARAALSQLLTAVEAVAGADVERHLAAVADARRALQACGDPWGVALADFVETEIVLYHGSTAQALALGRRAAKAFDALADTWGRSAVRLHLGVGLRLAGRCDEADVMLHEAVRLTRDRGLPNNLARSLIELGETALHRGNPTEADRWLGHGERIARDLADESMLALVALARGTAARLRDDPEVARLPYADALDRCERNHVPRGVARALAGIAAAALDEGRADDAVATHLGRAGDIAEQIGDALLRATVLEQLARLAALRGDDDARARCLADAADLRARHSRPRAAVDERDTQRMVTTTS
ncbi:MAG TPA: BTAD domain-containing putative transcriptional regulator [Euzebyales bacterium]